MSRVADTKIPQTVSIGESLWCVITLADYPASTHTAMLYLDGTFSGTVTATAQGEDHLFLVNPAAQTLWSAGPAAWRIIVTAKTGGVATLADSGIITILGVDHDLAYARTVMAAIDAMIQGRASKEQSNLNLDGMSIGLISATSLMELHRQWQNEVARLERRSMNQLGFGGPIRTISPRFENSDVGRPLFPRLYP
ncbi:MAG: hypothetical protein M0R00_07265 [Candidatus Omnitrophica bacterium]|jgi:hypothetical protein|nr:hypothetical protein [Candidatus Omnitrophota bacterium]